MCCYPALSQVLQSVSPSHGPVDHTLQRTPSVHQLLFTLVHTACPAHLLILLCPCAHFQFPRSPADHFTDLIAVLTIPKAPEKPHSASTLSTCFGVNFCLLQSVHLFHSWVFSSFLGNPGGMPLSVLESQVGSGKWDVLQGRFGSSLSNLSEGEVPAVGGVSEQGGEKSNLPLGLCQPPWSTAQLQSLSPKYPSSLHCSLPALKRLDVEMGRDSVAYPSFLVTSSPPPVMYPHLPPAHYLPLLGPKHIFQ